MKTTKIYSMSLKDRTKHAAFYRQEWTANHIVISSYLRLDVLNAYRIMRLNKMGNYTARRLIWGLLYSSSQTQPKFISGGHLHPIGSR